MHCADKECRCVSACGCTQKHQVEEYNEKTYKIKLQRGEEEQKTPSEWLSQRSKELMAQHMNEYPHKFLEETF